MNEILDFAKNLDVYVCLENSPNKEKKILKTVDDFKALFKMINSDSLYITFDFVHADSVSEVMNFIKQLNSKIKHIHIADNDGSMHNPLPIGSGRIDFEEAFRQLKKEGFNRYMIIEEKIGEDIILREKRKINDMWNKVKK
jgi:sugar phosphate isomerase/epimerase